MKLLRIAAVAAALMLPAAPALAQDSVGSDEFKIGPIKIEQEFQGTKVAMPVNLYLNLSANPQRIAFRARAFGDLSDLQAKTDRMLKSVPLPNDNCASYSSDNIVAKINRARLEASGETAVLRIDGTVQVWQCTENILQDVRIEWKVKKLCCGIKTKVPVRVKVSRSSPIKTRLLSQSFDAKIPVRIVRPTPNAVGVEVDRLDVDLNGDFASLLQRALFYGGVDLNAIGQKMINKTLRANTIPLLVPPDFRIFNPTLDRAAFVNDGGKLKIAVVMSGGLNEGQVPENLKEITAGLSER